MKLTPRLTLIFILYAAALLSAVGVLAYGSGRTALRAATIAELSTTAIEKQAALNEWVREKRADIAALSADPTTISETSALISVPPGSPETGSAHDRLIAEFQPRINSGEFLAVMLIDPETGEVIVSTDPSEEGKFKEDRPFFINGRTGPYVQNVSYALALQGPEMVASAPLWTPNGKLLGVLAGRLDLEEVNDIINRRSGLRQTDDAFLVNTSSLFVTQPYLVTDPAVLQVGVRTEAVDRCLTGSSGTVEAVDYRGVPALIVYRWLPERQLCLIVKIDQAEAYAPVRMFGGTVAAISTLALLTAILIAIVLSRSLSQPILALQAGVARFGRGELEIKLSAASHDELGELAHEFNKMAAALLEKDAELRTYAQTLELRVEERTAAIKEREKRYRSYIEVTGQLGWTANAEGEIEDMPEWGKYTGQQDEEVKGWGWSKALHPDDLERVTQAWRNAVAARNNYEAEYRIRRYDGEYRHFLARGVPIYNDEGELWEWVGACIDITERKQAEEELRHSEALLLQTSEMAKVGGWKLDLQTNTLYWSSETYRIHEVDPSTQPDLENAINYYAPEARPQIAEAVRQAIEEGQSYDLELPVVTAKGRQIWVRTMGQQEFRDGVCVGLLGTFQDITERRQAEEALRRFELLSANSKDIILFMRREDGRIIEANAAALRIYGYSHDELLALTVQDLRARDTQNLTADQIAQADAGGILFETIHRRRDGSTFPVEVSSQGATIGGVRTLISIVRDTTERKRVEAALLESEEKYRLLADNSNDWIYWVKPDRNFQYVSPSCERITGFTSPEFMNDPHLFYDIIHPEDRDRAETHLGDIREGGETHTLDYRVLTKTNEVRWISHSCDPVYTPDGTYMGQSGTNRDITERKQAEEKVQRSEAMLRAVLDQMPSGVTVRDALSGQLLLSNARSQEILNTLVDTPDHFDHYRGFHADGLPYRNEDWPLSRSIVTGEVIQAEEVNCRRSDDSWFTLSINSAPVRDLQGQVVMGVGVFDDITERKQAEGALQRMTEDLQRSNAELEQFAYVASHDLQEPLRMVSSYVQLLAKRYQGKLDGDADEFIAFAVDGAKRMQNLINDLLTYSRVGTRTSPLAPVSGSEVVREALKNLQFAIEENGAVITHKRLPVVKADPIQLTMVFQNLLGNAIKFHGSEPPLINIEAQRRRDEWIFSVCDNGIGFDPKFAERIFVIFQRLHDRSKYAGTGIGLAICKRIIQRHGGRMWVESQPGEGSTFYFTLPAGDTDLT